MQRVLLAIATVLGIIAVACASLAVWSAVDTRAVAAAQQTLDAFYTPPDPLPTEPGTLIRREPLGVDVPGGTGLRMLYVSQRPDGTPAVSGGMVFIPDGPAPEGGRPVVAWAHGTVGMGDACAPSRSANPLQDTEGWLEQMLSFGWVVASTDYIGLGTPGDELYLVGQAEARDVVNSVRAAREIPEADAGTRYAVWGHSQGGHSSLWTGHLGPELAPELQLLGVAAAAPAAELTEIVGAQWNTAIGWGIGPEVLISWPAVDAELSPEQIASPQGLDSYRQLAEQCTSSKTLGLTIATSSLVGQTFFAEDPTSNPIWAGFAEAQTPPPLPADMPVFMAQGTADQVVLPWPNAVLQDRWCEAGSTLTALWMGGVGHLQAADAGGPEAVRWIADRFAGRPAGRTCDVPPPPVGGPIEVTAS